MVALFERDVGVGVADPDQRDDKAGRSNHGGAEPDNGARRVASGKRSGGEGGGGDAQVAGRLVQTKRQATPGRSCQVDLHHHRH